MLNWRIYCLIILLCSVSLRLAAAPTTGSISIEHSEVYSRFLNLTRVSPKLAQATALAQDQQGFLWVGTQHGLYRFDGQQIKAYQADPAKTNTMSADWVSSLLVDRQGILWIGTRYGGLNRFNPATEQFNRVPLPTLPGEQQQVETSVVYQDPTGELWVGTYGGGLLRWDPDNARLETVALPLPLNELDSLYINALFRDSSGYLWIGTGNAPLRNRSVLQGGAIRWHPQQGHKQLLSVHSSALTTAAVTAIAADAQGQIWLTSYGGGLYQFDSASGILRPERNQPALLQHGLLTDIGFDRTGGRWVSSYDKGLWYAPAGSDRWQLFKANPLVSYQLPSNNLTGMLFDQQHTLWLKTPVGVFGLSAQAQQVRNIPLGPGDNKLLAHGDVFGIWYFSDQQIWLANRDAGLAELDLQRYVVQRWPLPVLPGLSKQPTLARQVVQAKNGLVYIGTDAGLFSFQPATRQWQLQSLRDGPQPHIGNLHLDSADRLWIGSRGEGLFLLEQGQVRHFQQTVRPGVALNNAVVSILASDAQDFLWIGLADQGLVRLHKNTGQLQSWQASDGSGLRFDGIQLIYPEGGHLWIRAGNINHRVLYQSQQADRVEGFKAYLSPADHDKYLEAAPQFLMLYRNKLLPGGLVQFGEMHGFQSTTWIGSWFIDPQQRQYRGGSQGLDIYPTKKLLEPDTALPVRLTGFSLFNRKVQVGSPDTMLQRAPGFAEQIQLRYEQDMFSLHFSALNFVDPLSMQYRYRLLGFDRDWIETDAVNPVATYTRLAPGRYQFEVMARSPGQSWADQSANQINIDILPPWWLTWWFKGLMVLLTLSLIWFVMQYRLRHERKTRMWLEKVVDQRTSELKSQHQALSNSYRDLSLLQTVARQITASLDLQEILLLVHRSLNDLMDVHVLAIGVYKDEQQVLEFGHWVENGQLMPPFELMLQGQSNLAAVCFAQQREVQTRTRQDFLLYLPELPTPLVGAAMQSVLYFPLSVKGEQIGCLTVQSPQQYAFLNEQTDLLRTLCSTIAIAVANANVVHRLQQTREQLVMQEKMASLGGLVAGVAHEINTPLGICVTAASHLQHELTQINQLQQDKRLTVQAFNDYLEGATATCQMLVNNTQRVAALVQSFKQVAVDRAAISVRELELSSYFAEVLMALEPELKKALCTVDYQPQPGLVLVADAGILARLLEHLLMNSLQHAFLPQQSDRQVRLQLSQQGSQILIQYQDNGQGMPAELLPRLFEPFFTTKRHQGYSGLGSHIIYNLVTVELHGSIQARSEAGQGLSYRILLPMLRRPD
ncbi:two-component regulator propeller domain-containing protein [Rheinheimera tilapiae]|uniref:histidine kinase n=1 Tax=Rheinheimera tilapiae TaxID=875043 RepID=A0ABV6BEY6_9GAMM